jgi:mannose-6-phosphate isomerase-like protein (cupin superfamily)
LPPTAGGNVVDYGWSIAMSDRPKREVVTIDGATVTLSHPVSPIENAGVEGGGELFHHLDVLDPRFRPENYNKADGAPLRLFDADSVKIDLSKRSHEDMGFWHRNVDYHEVIFCFRGALRWETELGTVTLKAGEMIVIPKGITHRSMLCPESEEENILIELKVRDGLTYVGDKTPSR